MNEHEERELIFSDAVENMLASAVTDGGPTINDLRARYRHSVLVDGMTPLTAAAYATSKQYTLVRDMPAVPDTVTILPEDEYSSPEHAIFSLAEYSGLGHEAIPALRASWMRAVQAGENPYQRVTELAIDTYYSPDADLLPRLD